MRKATWPCSPRAHESSPAAPGRSCVPTGQTSTDARSWPPDSATRHSNCSTGPGTTTTGWTPGSTATPSNASCATPVPGAHTGPRPATGPRRAGTPHRSAERRVARLIADGHSNRSAAGEPNVSVNTVGTHLRMVFSKLGVQSRVQLTNALHRAGAPWRRRTEAAPARRGAPPSAPPGRYGAAGTGRCADFQAGTRHFEGPPDRAYRGSDLHGGSGTSSGLVGRRAGWLVRFLPPFLAAAHRGCAAVPASAYGLTSTEACPGPVGSRSRSVGRGRPRRRTTSRGGAVPRFSRRRQPQPVRIDMTELAHERDVKGRRPVVRDGKLNGIFSFFSGPSAAGRESCPRTRFRRDRGPEQGRRPCVPSRRSRSHEPCNGAGSHADEA
ncbi:response regulator transcription factor [Streptomyces sp. L7]